MTTTDITQRADKIMARSLHLTIQAGTPDMLDEKKYRSWLIKWRANYKQLSELLRVTKIQRSSKRIIKEFPEYANSAPMVANRAQGSVVLLKRVATEAMIGRGMAKTAIKASVEFKAELEQMMSDLVAEDAPVAGTA